MARFHTFGRVAVALVLAPTILVLPFVLLDVDPDVANASHARQFETVLTSTHFVYLPSISYEVACANPPSRTVIIGGRATVHGQSAAAGIPFRLLYSAHWDIRPAYILTATTRSNGDFCFGPVDMLKYRGSWYMVVFNPEWIFGEDYAHWASPMLREGEIESGKVYTFVAEIGK